MADFRMLSTSGILGYGYPEESLERGIAMGLDAIGAYQNTVAIPGFAIGSINGDTIDAVIEAGARRVAICTGIIAADDIEGAARAFRDRLDAASV